MAQPRQGGAHRRKTKLPPTLISNAGSKSAPGRLGPFWTHRTNPCSIGGRDSLSERESGSRGRTSSSPAVSATSTNLNGQIDDWLATIANVRVHGKKKKVVAEAFAAEKPELQALPATPFDALMKLERRVSHDGLVSIGGNYYSVPDRTHRVVEVQQLPASRWKGVAGPELAPEHRQDSFVRSITVVGLDVSS